MRPTVQLWPAQPVGACAPPALALWSLTRRPWGWSLHSPAPRFLFLSNRVYCTCLQFVRLKLETRRAWPVRNQEHCASASSLPHAESVKRAACAGTGPPGARVALPLVWGLHSKRGREPPAVKGCSRESASNLGLDLKRFLDLTAPGIKITLEKPLSPPPSGGHMAGANGAAFREASAALPPAQSRAHVCVRAGRGSRKTPLGFLAAKLACVPSPGGG